MLAKQLDADILSPRTTSLDFIKEIISSEIVISQSLHGLIFAELFQKPSAWITHSQDDLWTFKFHDWFSNTISPPKVPFPLTAPPTEILNGAQLTGLNVDKDALRHAFPSLSSSNRAPGLGFRECRRLSPLIIGITSDGRRPTSADGYDTTFHCEFGNDEMLRLLLNAYSTQFDEAMASFLIFDSSIYDGLSSAGMRRSVELLTELPSVHYFGILPATSRTASQTHASGRFNDHRFEVDAWDANFGWRGAVLIRSLVNFSFAAPGLALFRTQLEIGSREVS
jgi:hypothetical protein